MSVTCRVGSERTEWYLSDGNRKLPWRGGVEPCGHVQEQERMIVGNGSQVVVVLEGVPRDGFVVYGDLSRKALLMTWLRVLPLLRSVHQRAPGTSVTVFAHLIGGMFSSGESCVCRAESGVCLRCMVKGSTGRALFPGGWCVERGSVCTCLSSDG